MSNIHPFVQVPYSVVQSGQPYIQDMSTNRADAPNIRKFMYEFNDKYRQKFNNFWFDRDDDAIINGIMKVILSCQRDKYFTLKVEKFEVIKNYEAIRTKLRERFAGRTKNGKKQDNLYDYINLRDSDIMLLVVTYYIKINRPEDQIRNDPKTKQPEKLEGHEEVLIALPRYVNKYYFRIQGNYYAPMFQIVDGSTYNNRTSNSKTQTVTLKTRFMPIKMYREFYKLIDITTGDEIKCCLFSSYIFAKKCDVCKYILGRYGLYGAMELLELSHIRLSTEVNNSENMYNFICRDKVTVISVPKMIFDNDAVTQSLIYTLTTSIYKYDKWGDIFDPRYWNKVLGAVFLSASLDKGIPVLDSLESIYDIMTKECTKLPEEDKADVYRILRWMMREFSALREKNNLDISTKRIRNANEYLDCIYAMKLSKALYRISDKGKSVKYTDVIKAVVNIAPDYILTQINTSNLVSYVSEVNDNDAALALEYTYKGISGLGDQGGSAVPLIYRSIHPSHLGRVDLDASSASDPGLSGSICPMAQVYDGFFSEYEEPNSWREMYNEMLDEYHRLNGIKQAIEIKKAMGLEFDYVKDDMVRETLSTYEKLINPVIDENGKLNYGIEVVINDENDGTTAANLDHIREDLIVPTTLSTSTSEEDASAIEDE